MFQFLQMILVNPICVMAYSLASWKFFNERVTVEEITLINFFGEQYIDYQKKVSTGLPLIKGYRLEEWLLQVTAESVNPSAEWALD